MDKILKREDYEEYEKEIDDTLEELEEKEIGDNVNLNQINDINKKV